MLSFQRIERWIDKITNEAHDDCVIVFAGNKRNCDSAAFSSHFADCRVVDIVEESPNKRQVPFADAQALAAQYKGEAFEVSAKTGVGVAEIFDAVLRLSIKRDAFDNGRDDPGNVNLSHAPSSVSSSSCRC